METSSPTWPVRVSYTLATILLLATAAFGAVLLASIVVGVARHGDSLLYGHNLRIPLELSPDEVTGLPADVEVTTWPSVTVVVENPTTQQMMLRSLMDVGPLVLALAGLWLTRGFLRSVLTGDPFGQANVRRLRAGGFLLLVGGPIVLLVNYSLRQMLFGELPPHESLDLGMQGFALPLGPVLASLPCFVLAEVFAHGARLREDVEATI